MNLSQRLTQPEPVIAVGVFDALTAVIAEQAGFEAVFVSGSALAFSQLARPDIGLVTLTETALAVERIRDRVDLKLLVDADSGFGNAFNVGRTVRMLERAGANGVQLEDQLNTKRPNDVTNRPLVSTQSMVGKIKAALDARQHESTIISARTDAAYTLGVDQALQRAEAFREAGADMVFVEGLPGKTEIARLCTQCAERVPVLYNALDPNKISAADLQELGVSLILYPSVLINSMSNAGRAAAAKLAEQVGIAKTSDVEDKSIAEIIDVPKQLQDGQRYGD